MSSPNTDSRYDDVEWINQMCSADYNSKYRETYSVEDIESIYEDVKDLM